MFLKCTWCPPARPQEHVSMKCYSLGLALDTFRMVALDSNFRKLDEVAVAAYYRSAERRLIFLDWDGTLIPTTALSPKPPQDVINVLKVRSRWLLLINVLAYAGICAGTQRFQNIADCR